MIQGIQYIEAVKSYYSFLIHEFNFDIITEKVRGNTFYEVEYGNTQRIISISYENIEDYFRVILFILENGERPDYDDKTRTLHLNTLNNSILKNVEKDAFILNEKYFSNYKAESKIEAKLLKEAKELRLYLT